jgi:hypothetical protein
MVAIINSCSHVSFKIMLALIILFRYYEVGVVRLQGTKLSTLTNDNESHAFFFFFPIRLVK